MPTTVTAKAKKNQASVDISPSTYFIVSVGVLGYCNIFFREIS